MATRKRRAVATRAARFTPKYKSKWEAEYAVILAARQRAGEILWYAYEPITIRLADGRRYTPDYIVLNAREELELHEVKGRWMEAAAVRTAVALEKFPIPFYVVRRLTAGRGKKKQVTWNITEME